MICFGALEEVQETLKAPRPRGLCTLSCEDGLPFHDQLSGGHVRMDWSLLSLAEPGPCSAVSYMCLTCRTDRMRISWESTQHFTGGAMNAVRPVHEHRP